jgi:hypothetical protein
MYTDTPVPQEEPAGQNPPDGAVLDYYLPVAAKQVSLEILDEKGFTVRRYTSADTMYTIPDVNIPHYWIRPQQILSAAAEAHRFLWDMKYTPLNVPPVYPISATYMNTAPEATSPWVMPGNYTVRLTVDGQQFSQPFKVRMDPRVKTTTADLQLQHDLSLMCYQNITKCMKAMKEINSQKDAETKELQATLSGYISSFTAVHNALQDSDFPPTTQMVRSAKEAEKNFDAFWRKWKGK